MKPKMRLVKQRPSGINTWQLIDSNGEDKVEYWPNSRIVKDWGQRLIRETNNQTRLPL
jgi:hypothetical protein